MGGRATNHKPRRHRKVLQALIRRKKGCRLVPGSVRGAEAGKKYKKPTRRGRRQHNLRGFTDTHTISGRDNQIVYNISSYNLSPTEYNVLQKGLSFCPTPSFNGFTLDQELHRFFRSLRLKVHFRNNPVEEMTTGVDNSNQFTTAFHLKQLGLRVPSNYNPPRVYHPIETYISLVKRDVESDLKSIRKGSMHIHRNLSVIEKEALRSLQENKRIIIKPADKGGSIVVMDKSHYTSIIQMQLSDGTSYQPIDRDPTFDIAREIRQMVEKYKEKGMIDVKLSEYLINTQPMTPVFYILPKVHKDLMNPPGRPIVASTNSLLSPLAITLDRILTPLLQNISSYLKDTTDFLSKLHAITPVASGCTLVTLDVNSLYTCINHQTGVEAVQWFLTKYTDFSPDQLQFCVDLLVLVLNKNFFLFGDQYYIQKTGTAMGSNMAPPYANIFMASFEETYVYTHSLFQKYSIYWKRYIDDVFMIWKGDENLLLQFVSDMNSCVPNLTFSMQKSTISINFLDTMITLEADGNLDVDLYCKPTDKNSLLHYSSCHPRHVKQSLPLSQYHRLSRIISNEGKQAIRHQEMSNKFLQRGYPLRTLQKARINITNKEENLGRQRIPFVSTFHPYLYKIKYCVLRHWDLLGKAYPNIREFKDKPIMCYKKPSNLRNLWCLDALRYLIRLRLRGISLFLFLHRALRLSSDISGLMSGRMRISLRLYIPRRLRCLSWLTSDVPVSPPARMHTTPWENPGSRNPRPKKNPKQLRQIQNTKAVPIIIRKFQFNTTSEKTNHDIFTSTDAQQRARTDYVTAPSNLSVTARGRCRRSRSEEQLFSKTFVNDIFRDMLSTSVVVYLDDILIYSPDIDSHRRDVCKVFDLLRANSLYAKLEKCMFEQESLPFLGYIISAQGLAMDPAKLQAVMDWQEPHSLKAVQRFMGFINYYRQFIPHFSTLVAPLVALTKKGANPKLWSEEVSKAFNSIKSHFASAPILHRPDVDKPFIMEVDASSVGAGAVLFQKDAQGRKHPCFFSSKTFSPAERNYSIGDRELLAMKLAFSEWRHLLEGARFPFQVFTDHKNLVYLQTAQRLNSRQARWSLFFSRFHFTLHFLSGEKNIRADALSRSIVSSAEEEEEPRLIVPTESLRTVALVSLESVTPGKTFVPSSLRPEVLSWAHSSRVGGHFGTKRTSELLARTYWWPHMARDVTEQDDWASLPPWAEFALNNAIADSTGQTPFLLNYGQHPRVPVPMPVSSADSRVADWAVEARDIWDRTQDAIRASKERMRSSADVHRRPAPTFAPGDLVWLSARNIRLRVESTKFAPRYLGPFKVLERVNPVVYRLALPPRLGITDTFHVSLLKPVYMSRFSESSAGTSGSSTDDYEVNAILGCKVVRGKKFYLVDWKGYGPEDRSWEPAEYIRAPQLIAAFERSEAQGGGALGGEVTNNKDHAVP
ncbi:unnamed protein product [Ranitomeya imitator]|uniref:ribonuclease H n=1 Tax=Ranitomeya imitator TaxID=111125 RepID=A0ABN9M247_9NEOB|nr:unnamed protein product [Ranitomeya imitator]